MSVLKAWLFLIPLLGVAIGWGLNEFSQFLRVRREDKKILNSILFSLIQMYGLFKKLNPEKFETYLRSLTMKIPQLNQGFQDFIPQLSRYFFSKQIKDAFDNDLVSLESSFFEAIKNLSSINPIMAVRLKNSVGIKKIFESLKVMFENIENDFELSNTNHNKIPDIAEYFKVPIIENSLMEIYRDSIYISSKIGWTTKYKCKRLLNEISEDFDDDTINNVALMLTPIISKMESDFNITMI